MEMFLKLPADGHGNDGDGDEDDVYVDADADADGIDGKHPCHLYTYHPFHPSHLHLFLSAELRCFWRGFSFLHSRLFPLRPSPLSHPVSRVELRASQD